VKRGQKSSQCEEPFEVRRDLSPGGGAEKVLTSRNNQTAFEGKATPEKDHTLSQRGG